MPDPTSRICVSSIFPKTAWIIFRKTDPDPMWTVWSGFGQTPLVWKQAGVQEPSGPVSGRTQPAPLPVSHFQTRFRSSTDVPDNIVQNQPGSDLVLADCVRFWAKRIRSGSKPVCKNHWAKRIRSGSKPVCKNHWAKRIRSGSGKPVC